MSRFLTFVAIAALGTLTIGCENQQGTTENKTETKVSQTRDGKTAERTTSVDTKTTTTPATPDGTGTKTKETTETITDTVK